MDISQNDTVVKFGAGDDQAKPDGPGSLLYLNSNNGAEISKKSSVELLRKCYDYGCNADELLGSLLSPYNRKQAFALVQNCQNFVKRVGLNNIGFLTLTFKENVTEHKEATRRLKSLRKHFLTPNFGEWMRVSERQKRGAWHFHILIDCGKDIRTGINFDQIYGKNGRPQYSSAQPFLRSLWSSLRSACKKYGFGRSELLPIQSNKEGISKYIGKYLSKHNVLRDEKDKGVRLVGYSSKSHRTNTKFQWHSDGSKEWRRKVARFADILCIGDISEFSMHFGSKWCHRLAPFIVSVDSLPVAGIIRIANEMALSGFPFKFETIDPQTSELVNSRTGEVLF